MTPPRCEVTPRAKRCSPTTSTSSSCSRSTSSSSSPSAGFGVSRRSLSVTKLKQLHPQEVFVDASPTRINSRSRRKRVAMRYPALYMMGWTIFVVACLLYQCVPRWIVSSSWQRQQGGLRATPTTTIDWEPSSVVHVIETRFMQQQPHLVELGLARLEIFKSFCLPTIRQQSSQNFLWIIRTDPDLDTRVKQPLLELLSANPHDNHVLVASDSNPEGFRDGGSIAGITPENVWSGDYNLIQQYHKAAQSHLVLESRLDADDGIHQGFVEYLQKEAPKGITTNKSWNIWCAYSHLEWQYSSPYRKVDDVDEGFWVGIKNTGCVTPGLTMVYGLDAVRSDLPKGTHQYLHKVLKACSDKKHKTDHCLRRFKALMPGAIRARTPTSAGMANVVVESPTEKKKILKAYKQAGKQVNLQDDLWSGVEVIFGITKQAAKETRDYVKAHLLEIAADNLRGQCTSGHSCKNESKKILEELMRNVNATNYNSSLK